MLTVSEIRQIATRFEVDVEHLDPQGVRALLPGGKVVDFIIDTLDPHAPRWIARSGPDGPPAAVVTGAGDVERVLLDANPDLQRRPADVRLTDPFAWRKGG